jgi:alpha-mannosidase
LRQQNLEGTPKFKFAFAKDFFEKIKEIPQEKLPRWVGELYLELHRGTYTTQGLMKKYNRKLEHKLRDIEFLSVITQEKINKELDPIWKDTLLNQFHDILPGSSINWVYKDAHALSEQNLKKLSEIETKLIAKLAKESPDKHFFMVFNSLSWERNETIELPFEEGTYRIRTKDDIQIRETIEGNLPIKITVPSLGYASLVIEKTTETDYNPKLLITKNSLENSLIRVTFAQDGTISSIFDKEINREVIQDYANKFQLWEDKPNNWGAWDVNHFYRETTPEQAKLVKILNIEPTDLLIKRVQEFTIGNSTIKQIISLEANSKRINFKTTVDWQEEHKMLRVSAKPNIHTNEASFEIQYGTLKRANHQNTSWDQAKFEVCAHRFADLSEPNYGFAVLNDCKYGYYVQGNEIDLNLLRSPKDTDKEADLHIHEFTYSYLPHANQLINSDTFKEAHILNSPLFCYPVMTLPEKKSFSWAQLSNNDVKIEVVKYAEDSDNIVIRLYETKGKRANTKLKLNNNYSQLQEINLIERELNKQIIKDSYGEFTLEFTPFEIKTYKLC